MSTQRTAARTALREMQKAHKAATDTHTQALRNSERGSMAAQATLDRLRDYDAVDGAIADYLASAIRSGGDNRSLPTTLVEARRSKAAAAEALDDAVAVNAILAGEAAEAGQAVAQTGMDLGAACLAVMHDDLVAHVERLRAIERVAGSIRASIGAYCSVVARGDTMVLSRMPSGSGGLGRDQQAAALLSLVSADYRAGIGRVWTAYQATLREDADAELAELPV